MTISYNICLGLHISVLALWLVSYHLSRVQEQKKNEDNPVPWKIRFNGQNEYEHQKQMGWSLWCHHFDMKTNCFPYIFPHLLSTSNIEPTCTQNSCEVKPWAPALWVVCLWFWIWFPTNFLWWNYTTDFRK